MATAHKIDYRIRNQIKLMKPKISIIAGPCQHESLEQSLETWNTNAKDIDIIR